MMTRLYGLVCFVLFLGWVVVSKRLDHASNHPTIPLRASAGTPTGRDDTVLWSEGGLFLGRVLVSKRLDPV